MSIKGYWISDLIGYYEGSQLAISDISIPVPRPDPTYDWNGNAWVVNAGRATAAQAQTQIIADANAVLATPLIQALTNATDAQISAFVGSHSTADAGTQTLLVLLARAVRILLQRGLQ